MPSRRTILASLIIFASLTFTSAPGLAGGSVGGAYQVPDWETYARTAGPHGWSYDQRMADQRPAYPNQLAAPFSNPLTGAGLFKPQDTRLRGRDRP